MASELIKPRLIDDIMVVRLLRPRLVDEMVLADLFNDIDSLIGSENVTKMVLEFEDIEFLSSAALGKLTTLHKKLDSPNGGLVLCGIDPSIWKAFTISGLDKFFTTYPTYKEAVAHLL